MSPDQLTGWVSSFSYPLVFALLLASGGGVPLSEDVILVVGGLVVARGNGTLELMVLTGLLGTLAGDQLLYRLGRRLGARAVTSKSLGKLLTPARVAWIEEHFRRNGPLTIFTVRFLPGLRAPTFLVAGISRFPPRKFLIADVLGAMITAPLLTWLGFQFGANVLGDLKLASRWILIAVAVALAGVIARRIYRRLRARAA